MIKKTIELPGVKSIAPIAPATKANGFIFTSGQLGWDGRNNYFFGDDIESQTRGAFDNLTSNFPARTCLEVANLPLNGLIEIEAIAIEA